MSQFTVRFPSAHTPRWRLFLSRRLAATVSRTPVMWRWRTALALLASAFLAAGPGAATVDAGTFNVITCATGRQEAGVPVMGVRSGATAFSACPANGDRFRGIVAGVSAESGPFTDGDHVYYHFDAAGNRIRWLYAQLTMVCGGNGWYAGLFDGGHGWFWGLGAAATGWDCLPPMPNSGPRPYMALNVRGRTALRWGVLCRAVSCAASRPTWNGQWRYRAGAERMLFSVEDTAAPTLAVTGGSALAVPWLTGPRSITYRASDATGIASEVVVVARSGGSVVRRQERTLACDRARVPASEEGAAFGDSGHEQEWFWIRVADQAGRTYHTFRPCPQLSGEYVLDTTTLADGEYRVAIAATDAAGNGALQSGPALRIDNTPPPAIEPVVEPSQLALNRSDASAWRRENRFVVRWRNPDRLNGAPYSTVEWEICALGGGRCREERARIDGASGASNGLVLAVPAVGEWQLRVRLRDEAGHAGPWSRARVLRYDSTIPERAQVDRRNGWLNDAEARSYRSTVRMELERSTAAPASGIAGYSVALDRDPDDTVDVWSDGRRASGYEAHVTLAELSEGVHELRARAISGSGAASSEIDATTLAVDRTPPALQLEAPPAGVWQRDGVRVTVTARDQAHLSGMLPARSETKDGGFVRISTRTAARRCDGRSPAEASCTLEIAADGRHVLAFEAFDVAGNRAVGPATVVLIDRTPPSGWIERPVPSDPTRLLAAVNDAVSGVAAARFEFRALGESDWRPLATEKVAAGRFQARLRDETLAPGRYELRLLAKDVAGNIASIETFGAPSGARPRAIVAVPLRDRPRLGLAAPLTPRPSPPSVVAFAWFEGEHLVVSGRIDPQAAGKVQIAATTRRRTVRAIARLRDSRFTARLRLGRGRENARVTVVFPGSAAVRSARVSFVATRPSGGSGLLRVGSLDLDRSPLALAFGVASVVSGRLVASDGRAIPGARIALERRPFGGWPAEPLGTAVTGEGGAFTVLVPPGPSGRIVATFAGDGRALPATTATELRVAARVRLAASRRTLRNGDTLGLRGRVGGGYVPPEGVIVALQALAGDRWRTFETVRTDSSGRFQADYTFRSVTARTRFRLRAVALRQAGWPYEPGASPVVSVAVRVRRP